MDFGPMQKSARGSRSRHSFKVPDIECAAMELCLAVVGDVSVQNIHAHDAFHRVACNVVRDIEQKTRATNRAGCSSLHALDQSLIVAVSILASTPSCEGDVVRHAPAPWATASLRNEALTGSESPKRKFDVAPTGCSTALPGRPGRPTIRPVSASRYYTTGVGIGIVQQTRGRQVRRQQAIVVGGFGPLR